MVDLRRRVMVSVVGDDDYVDLGLPSGVLWARGNITKNSQGNYKIGAPESCDTYFSWGNIDGHLYNDGYAFTSPNYSSTPGGSLSTDIPVNATYDAARARLGGNWRMHTYAEMQELAENVTCSWTQVNGVTGLMLTSKNNGETLFIPAGGRMQNTSRNDYGTCGVSWANKRNGSYAHRLRVLKSRIDYSESSWNTKNNGFNIRPVCKLYWNIVITLNPTDGSSVSGVSVTVTDSDGVAHTGTTSSNGQVSFSGVAGGKATVSATDYVLSTNSSIYVSADAKAFTCNCTNLPLGVYAYYSDGTLKDYNHADTNAIGVAVITNNCRFVIDKTDAVYGSPAYQFGGYGKDLSNIGVTISSDKNTAVQDFNGESNTTKLITALNGYTDMFGVQGAPAASACRAAFNGQGYLGSLGEWRAAAINSSTVDSFLSRIGGNPMSNSYWTSTQYDTTAYTWYCIWSGDTDPSGDMRGMQFPVRAFRSL